MNKQLNNLDRGVKVLLISYLTGGDGGRGFRRRGGGRLPLHAQTAVQVSVKGLTVGGHVTVRRICPVLTSVS